MYEHKYTTTTCSECGADLTKPVSVVLGVSVNDCVSEHKTRLDPKGILIDVDRMVANGYHSHTECADCRHDLCEEEDLGYEPPPAPIPRILIVVEGGMVRNLVSDTQVTYQVKDWDCIKHEHGAAEEIGMDQFGGLVTVCDTEAAFEKEVMAGIDEFVKEHKENHNG